MIGSIVFAAAAVTQSVGIDCLLSSLKSSERTAIAESRKARLDGPTTSVNQQRKAVKELQLNAKKCAKKGHWATKQTQAAAEFAGYSAILTVQQEQLTEMGVNLSHIDKLYQTLSDGEKSQVAVGEFPSKPGNRFDAEMAAVDSNMKGQIKYSGYKFGVSAGKGVYSRVMMDIAERRFSRCANERIGCE